MKKETTRKFDDQDTIRDSRFLKLKIVYSSYGKDESKNTNSNVTIEFEKNEKELIILTIFKVTKLDFFEETLDQVYVENIKITESNKGITFCFDPYDERSDTIDDRDNCVIEGESYEIITNKY